MRTERTTITMRLKILTVILAAALALTLLLAACDQDPEPTATPMPTAAATPTPTTTPVPTATATPVPTPSPPPTPLPLAERVAAYAQACEAVEVSVSDALADVNFDAEDEDITWEEFAESMDALVDAYGRLSPPEELRAYHDANLRVNEAIRDHAKTRPGDDSFATEYILVLVEILGAVFEIGFDETKTQEEQERQIEEFANEKLGELFGPDFGTANLALEDATAGLSEETLALLEGSGCDSFGDVFGENQDTTEPEESSADDHGDDFESATSVSVGVAVDGVLDHDGDMDFFRFAAEEGHFYQVDTTLDAESAWLEAHVPDADSPGQLVRADPRNGWEAQASGDSYIAVGTRFGPDVWEGSYTLTITELVDDRGSSIDGATAVSLGEPVEGVIGWTGDRDYFRFTAEAGETYHFDAALGTRPTRNLEVLNSDGDVLETKLWARYEGGVLIGSVIAWEAEESGDYYVEVRGGFLGSQIGAYTLTITHVQ